MKCTTSGGAVGRLSNFARAADRDLPLGAHRGFCCPALQCCDNRNRLKSSPKPRFELSGSATQTPPNARSSHVDLLIYVLLFFVIFASYVQVHTHDFVSYDDPIYVTENPQVQAGVTSAGLVWALTTFRDSNWFPLTWLSHMLDVELFGLDSGWHHLTNVLFHAFSTVVLFIALRRMTNARWQSMLVALLFGLHPLHVESVAWIAERKDVLSGLFWMLTLWAYAGYTTRPTRVRYSLCLLLFCLGLMAKQMLVTLPLVLVLLDLWPLCRGVLLLEKLPFFGASFAASIVA